MNVWQLVLPETGNGPCDAVSCAHPLLLSGGSVKAALLDVNPLSDSGAALPSGLSAPVAVIRSGWIETVTDDQTGRIDAARRTWSGEGWERFDRAWSGLAEESQGRGVGLWLHPHVGDVVGDVPALRSLALGSVSEAMGVLFEPTALLSGSMISNASDHFVRMIEPLESSGLVRAVLVTNTDGQTRVPVREGLVDPDVLFGLAEEALAWSPVALLEADVGMFA